MNCIKLVQDASGPDEVNEEACACAYTWYSQTNTQFCKI